jgi:dTDP-4-amino-4,6-dideoxygalactose transaminase
VDVGSSYVPSEICSAFLYAQLERLDAIAARRPTIYRRYLERLRPLEEQGLLRLPCFPEECDSNYHLFYILLPDGPTRDGLMAHLRQNGILAVFHYVPLHSSPVGQKFVYRDGQFPVTEDLSGRLLRLPLYYDLTEEDQGRVVEGVRTFLELRAARQPARANA